MIKKILSRILILLAIALFSTCGYEFSEDYFKEIIITEPNANISLLDFADGQIIKKYTDVNFKFNGDNRHNLYEIKFFIDDDLITTSQNEEDTFPIDIYNLNEGNHILKIEYYFSSGTGSLGELYGLEAYKTVENLNFVIDKSVADAFQINTVEIENGSLYIYWDDVIDDDFDEAYLAIKRNGYLDAEILLSEDQILNKVYNDTINTSGDLRYYIKVKNDFNISNSLEKSITIEQPNITHQIIDFNKVKISWLKHPLYSNFDYYIFDSSLNRYERIKLDKEGGNFTINIDLIFEKDYYYSFRFIKERPYYVDVDQVNKVVSIAEDFNKKYCDNYIYNQNTNIIYALELVGSGATKTVFIHELSPEDLSVLKSTEITQTIDRYANLSIASSSQDLIIDFSEKSIVVDHNSYNILKSYNAKDYLPDLPYSYTSYNRKNTFAIKAVSRDDTTYIFNSSTKKLIKSFPRGATFFKMSNDGKYFAYNTTIYKIENNNVTELTSTIGGVNIQSLDFDSDSSKCVYTFSFSAPILYDLNSNSKTVLNALTDSKHISFDYSTNKVLSYQDYPSSEPFAEVLDLDSNEKISIRIKNINSTLTYYVLENNKLIFSRGKYLNLK